MIEIPGDSMIFQNVAQNCWCVLLLVQQVIASRKKERPQQRMRWRVNIKQAPEQVSVQFVYRMGQSINHQIDSCISSFLACI